MNPNQELKMTISLLKNKVEEQEKTIQFLTSKMEGVSDLLYQFVGGLFCQRTQSSIINMHLNCLYDAEIQQGKREKLEFEEKEEAEINGWPTTRQGDSNEKRIEELEAQIKKLTDFGPIEKVFEDDKDEDEDEDEDEDYEDMREEYEAELTKYEAELRAEYEAEIRAEYEDKEEEEEEDEDDSALLSLKHMRSHFSMYDSEDSSSTHSSMPGLIDIDDDLSSVSSADIRVRISSELCGNE